MKTHYCYKCQIETNHRLDKERGEWRCNVCNEVNEYETTAEQNYIDKHSENKRLWERRRRISNENNSS